MTVAVGTRRIAVISTEYLKVRTYADVPLDMAAPMLAFTVTGVIAAWQPTVWVGNTVIADNDTGGQSFYRDHQILIGPVNDGLALDAGTYRVWRNLVDNPEIPISIVGTLVMY